MRYTGFFPVTSYFPRMGYGLVPLYCSLKPGNLYLTKLKTAISNERVSYLCFRVYCTG
ncbi:MAG: hypothetical protein F6K56_18475 [Moorea sp. SIO3G5]|nr:hypothetical protein [Moorena sp. SIO3G5]